MAGVWSLYYVAVRPFTSEARREWDGWLEEAGLSRLRTLVTLDTTACPRLVSVDDLREEDWLHNLNADFLQAFFRDLGYLLRRTSGANRLVLAAALEPFEECAAAEHAERFAFAGYDIMDRQTARSLLLNCGPLPAAFAPDELNDVGLLPTLALATAVKGRLLIHYPDHGHVKGCAIWALWTMVSDARGASGEPPGASP